MHHVRGFRHRCGVETKTDRRENECRQYDCINGRRDALFDRGDFEILSMCVHDFSFDVNVVLLVELLLVLLFDAV
jgi:hypothetical protein